jgi:hypothetical protein
MRKGERTSISRDEKLTYYKLSLLSDVVVFAVLKLLAVFCCSKGINDVLNAWSYSSITKTE